MLRLEPMNQQHATIQKSSIAGLFEILPIAHKDSRGEFAEVFVEKDFARQTSFDFRVVQVNTSTSEKGVLRGAHLQSGDDAQRKLLTVSAGKILDVVIDTRQHSPTFGRVEHFYLDPEEGRQLFIDSGLAHSFLSLEKGTRVTYYCDRYYEPKSEISINPFSIGFDFQSIARDWKIEEILQSNKDLAGLDFEDFF